MVSFEQIINGITSYFVANGPTLFYALATLVIGWWVIKIIVEAMGKNFEKKQYDPSLTRFLSSLVGVILRVALLISVISMIGVQTTSFIALLGAAGLAVGLALQGSLSNFAGGVLILIIKPFKVGDYIEALGFTGTVEKIEIFNTTMVTLDNKVVVIPNGSLANTSIVNHYVKDIRRVDLTFGISYDDDSNKAIKLINDLLEKDKRVLKDPAPFVTISSIGEYSVNITMKAWANTDEMWDVYFDMMKWIKEEFDRNGIRLPYPQRELYMVDKK